MFDFVFRCDAGTVKNLGSGHIYRCITIAKLLIKEKKIKKNKILFVIKKNKKFSLGKKITDKTSFHVKYISDKIKDYSDNEISFLNKIKSKILIIDRLGKIKKKNIYQLKSNFKKLVLLEDQSNLHKLCDLTFNPLIQSKNKISKDSRNKNFYDLKFNILPSILYKKKTNKMYENSTFFFFGGYDYKKLNLKFLKKIKKSSYQKSFFYFHQNEKKYKIKNKNINYYSSKNFFEKLINCQKVVCSGGLIMFDALYLKKKVYVLNQYNHQLKNITSLKNVKNLTILKNIHQTYNKYQKKIKKKKFPITYKSQIFVINKIYQLLDLN